MLYEVITEDIIYVIRIPTQLTIFAGAVVGRRLPALTTSGGRAMVAGLPKAEREHAVANWRLVAHTPRTITDRARLADEIERAAADGYA